MARYELNIAFEIKLGARLQKLASYSHGLFCGQCSVSPLSAQCACRLPNDIVHYTMLAVRFSVLYLGLSILNGVWGLVKYIFSLVIFNVP